MKRLAIVVAVALAVGCSTRLAINSDAVAPPDGEGGADALATDDALADGPFTDGGADGPLPDSADGSGASKLRVFVTSATFVGVAMSTVDPDANCAAAAASKSLPGTFVAWISTNGLAARDRDLGTGPWFTMKGDFVAGSMSQVSDGVIGAAIDVTEEGMFLPAGSFAWTGSTFTGQVQAGKTCQSWSSDTGAGGQVGLVTSIVDLFRSDHVEPCTSSGHLYCFQKF